MSEDLYRHEELKNFGKGNQLMKYEREGHKLITRVESFGVSL